MSTAKAPAKQRTRDMTDGTIWKQLILFSIPLMIGNIFQQFYNTVDSIVVGNFVGSEALAAVTADAPAINALIGMFMGLATGASVVISQFFGAHDNARLRKAIHTSVVMTVVLGIFLTFAGYLVTPVLLKFMGTPPEVLPGATTYLHIYFLGVIGLMLYNTGAGILRAVGDSKRPLYFLIFSSLLNVVLDLFFVVALRLGVAGVGYATILSQFISAIIVFYVLFKSTDVYSLSMKEMSVDFAILRRIFTIGIPTGFQMAIVSFSNVFVLSYINRYGAASTAGWGIYGRIDAFQGLPLQSLSLAVTTFIGQNAGAKKPERIEKGIKEGLKLGFICMAVLSVGNFILAPFLASLFNNEAEVLYYSILYTRMNCLFGIVSVVNNIYVSVLRGLGDSKAPMIIMIFSFVIFRQLYLFAVTHITASIYPVSICFPMGWLVCSIIMIVYFKRSNWRKVFEAVE